MTTPVLQTDAPGASAATGAHCDDAGPSAVTGALLLEPLFADVVLSLSDEIKGIVSKSLKSYDAIVSKESRTVYENQMRIQEALDLINKSQSEIRQSQLSIERAKKVLVDDISSMLRERNIDGVSTEPPSCGDIPVKHRADVSPIFFITCSFFRYLMFIIRNLNKTLRHLCKCSGIFNDYC